MRYFKRRWDEPRDDEHEGWGGSVWLFEADEDLNVTRQLLIYDSGATLKYDESLLDDEYGGLTDQPLELKDYARYEITPAEFEAAWNAARPVNG